MCLLRTFLIFSNIFKYLSFFNCFLFTRPKDVLLYVKMGIPGERSYYPSEELVWNATHDSSPRSLRTCLAARYGLSPDSLLLAKHQPDKHIWEEISNWVRLDEGRFLSRNLVGGDTVYTCTLACTILCMKLDLAFTK